MTANIRKAALYPVTELDEPARPFKIWDAKRKQLMPHRCYQYIHMAHRSALFACAEGEPGHALEVFDSRNAKLLGQYLKVQIGEHENGRPKFAVRFFKV